MKRNRKKSLRKKSKPAAEEEIVAEPKAAASATRRRELSDATPVDGERRTAEVFGIVTLAAALLVGPSLVSLQFGDGQLMGPFGALLGRAIHAVFGLSGHVLAIGLALCALRIFRQAIGKKERPTSSLERWRKRTGLLLGLLSVAALLHLSLRPARLLEASYGGLLGELCGEVLCSIFSAVGAWLIALTGLALAVVLSTSFSWISLAKRLWFGGLAFFSATAQGLRQSIERLSAAGRFVGQQLARAQQGGELAVDGSASLPPVVRVELPELSEIMPKALEALPADLEIGGLARRAEMSQPAVRLEQIALTAQPRSEAHDDGLAALDDILVVEPPIVVGVESPVTSAHPVLEPSAPSVVASPARTRQQPASEGLATAELVDASEPTLREPALCEPDDAELAEEQAELTIVQSSFSADLSDEQVVEEKPVGKSDGPGFELKGDVYRAPPLSLLEDHEAEQADVDREAIYRLADRLAKTLADYKIEGRVTKVHPGPVVTMYEFVPKAGTRISKIANLANDLAMSLAAQRVRIVAPIPGKGAIGIEVPNERREAVSFKKIVADKSFQNPKSQLTLALGKNIFGAPITMDLAKMPHLLVAGATGAGKSVSVNAMICSLLLKYSPEEVRLIMVDPKFLELSGYNDIPHLMLPVVTDPKQANIALRWAVGEMERRYQTLAEMRVRDIASYNRKVDKLRGKKIDDPEVELDSRSIDEAAPSQVLVVRKNADGTEQQIAGGGLAAAAPAEQAGDRQGKAQRSKPRSGKDAPQRLPYIVVIIDEFADLMMVASKEVETSVARLAQKARAAGIHLIIATQRPSVDVITGLIKANFPSRMAFQVASGHDSKTILGSQGAENLLGSGDMLVLDRGTEMRRIHGAYISDEEIQAVTEWVRDQGRPVYDMDILKAPEEDEQGGPGNNADDHDELYDQAVAIVAEAQQASISMVQRRLRIGYNRSARMVERMEREGIVSPPDGAKGRQVLVNPQ
ncbi:MAG: DNA translocase FtsK [Deltaproteobacteria bacterium]|nr:DNA translocase FtsK [Deltaproteobacteria bacterium]